MSSEQYDFFLTSECGHENGMEYGFKIRPNWPIRDVKMVEKTPSQIDVTLWCYKWIGLDAVGWMLIWLTLDAKYRCKEYGGSAHGGQTPV